MHFPQAEKSCPCPKRGRFPVPSPDASPAAGRHPDKGRQAPGRRSAYAPCAGFRQPGSGASARYHSLQGRKNAQPCPPGHKPNGLPLSLPLAKTNAGFIINPSTSPPLAKGGLRGDLPLRDKVKLSESSISKTPAAFLWGQTLQPRCTRQLPLLRGA